MGYNVAIDGPAGAGKSTIAKLVAKEKGYIYVDTGAMYRGLAIHFLDKGIVAEDIDKIIEACQDADVTIRYENGVQQVYLNEVNITSRLRDEAVGSMASKSSAIPEVRAKLLELQRGLAKTQDVIMDGRDIGTCVLPNADVVACTQEALLQKLTWASAELGSSTSLETSIQLCSLIRACAEALRSLQQLQH